MTEQVLNLRNFVRDTNNFDVDAEIAVMIAGIPITLPVRGVTHTTTQDSSKKFVLLHISHEDVMQAWNYLQEQTPKEVN